MSNTITKREFLNNLAGGDGSLNINDLSPELQNKLQAAGVDRADLARIAGADAQIRGSKEFTALFEVLDQVDSDPPSTAFAYKQGTDPGAPPTVAGAAYDELKEEVANRRLAARSQGIVHFGMRPESQSEVDALRAVTPQSMGGVHSIRAYASDGTVDYGGRSHDLGTAAGRQAFRDALISGQDGVPQDREDRLIALLGGVAPETRDELAQLALALHRVGAGDLAANRLVISGHGSGRSVSADGPGWIQHDTIRDVAKLFPEGAAKIEHLAMSSCHSAKSSELDQFRGAFPGLKSFWGYEPTSPRAETGAPAHLRTWAGRTDGDDPSAVDPKGRNVATWNVADGEQRFSTISWPAAQQAMAASEWVFAEYQSGARSLPAGGHDPDLDRYYRDIQNALSSPGLPASERGALEQRRDEVLRLRHPELFP
jgi:hypothetical protein